MRYIGENERMTDYTLRKHNDNEFWYVITPLVTEMDVAAPGVSRILAQNTADDYRPETFALLSALPYGDDRDGERVVRKADGVGFGAERGSDEPEQD